MELSWDCYNPESTAERILLLGASLGGVSSHQWTAVAEQLRDEAIVIFVDHPGHGPAPVWEPEAEPTLGELAAGVAGVASAALERFGQFPVYYAGVSISGATALHVARDFAADFAGVVVLASAATVGVPERWQERATQVEATGTQQLLEETELRWFTSDFRTRRSDVVQATMEALAAADDYSYAQLCRALAVHDMRSSLSDIALPVLLLAGGAGHVHAAGQCGTGCRNDSGSGIAGDPRCLASGHAGPTGSCGGGAARLLRPHLAPPTQSPKRRLVSHLR